MWKVKSTSAVMGQRSPTRARIGRFRRDVHSRTDRRYNGIQEEVHNDSVAHLYSAT